LLAAHEAHAITGMLHTQQMCSPVRESQGDKQPTQNPAVKSVTPAASPSNDGTAEDCTPRRSKTKFFPIHIPSTPEVEFACKQFKAKRLGGGKKFAHRVHPDIYEFRPASDILDLNGLARCGRRRLLFRIECRLYNTTALFCP
jgi:hypothetical protein